MEFHRSVLGGELDVMTFDNVDGGGDETPTASSTSLSRSKTGTTPPAR